MTRTFNINVTVDDQFLKDILTCAYEGGIQYWADCRAERDDDLFVISLSDFYGVDEDDGEKLSAKVVDLDAVAEGIKKILEGEVRVNQSILGDIHRGVAENDPCDIDIERADCIVQAALFGEIIYG